MAVPLGAQRFPAGLAQTEPGPREEPLRFQWPRYILVVVVLALAVYALRPQLATLRMSLDIVRHLRWWALIAAAMARAASYWGSGRLLQAVLVVSGERLSLRRAVAITLASSSVGLVAGGLVGSAAATYRWCRAAGVRSEAALAAGWMPSIFNSIALLVFAVVGVLQLLLLHALTRWEVIGVSISAIVLLMGPVLIRWAFSPRTWIATMIERARAWRRRWSRQPPGAPGRVARSTQLFAAWDAMRAGGWRRALAGAMYSIGFDALTLFLLFVAARHTVSGGVLMAGYAVPLLLGRISALPGGLGVIEATMVTLYSGLDVPTAGAVLVVLSYRLVSFWLPALAGFPLIAYLQHRLPSPRTMAPPAPAA